jgi:hypothetical protein
MLVVVAVALAIVATGAPAASAGGSLLGLSNDCGQTSQPFAQFGDDRNYTFGANGGLENGGSGWSLSGADIVAGNESYFVHSGADRYSLALTSGDSALTPTGTRSRADLRPLAGRELDAGARDPEPRLAARARRRFVDSAEVHGVERNRPDRRHLRRSLGVAKLELSASA